MCFAFSLKHFQKSGSVDSKKDFDFWDYFGSDKEHFTPELIKLIYMF